MSEGTPKPKPSAPRADRVAASLRENLRRRKEQQRARAADRSAEAEAPPQDPQPKAPD